MMEAATRRASRISRGIDEASVRALPAACLTAPVSTSVARGSAIASLSDARFELADHVRNGFAFGAGREGQRHAVLEHGFGQLQHVVDRGCEAVEIGRASC